MSTESERREALKIVDRWASWIEDVSADMDAPGDRNKFRREHEHVRRALTEWQPIETAPKDRPILLAGQGWSIHRKPWGDAIWITVDGEPIGEVYGDKSAEVAEASARLIAAAPRLYKTLEDAPNPSKYHGQRGFEAERFLQDYQGWLTESCAALAEAKGEQP